LSVCGCEAGGDDNGEEEGASAIERVRSSSGGLATFVPKVSADTRRKKGLRAHVIEPDASFSCANSKPAHIKHIW
jgi:hypothetical protein